MEFFEGSFLSSHFASFPFFVQDDHIQMVTKNCFVYIYLLQAYTIIIEFQITVSHSLMAKRGLTE